MTDTPPEVGGPQDGESVGRPYTVTDALLRLLFCRKLYRIGKAMDEHYPTDADIEDLLTDPDTIEQLTGVALVVNDIRAQRLHSHITDVEGMIGLINQHYDRAVEEIELFASAHGISAEDLLVVLTKDA